MAAMKPDEKHDKAVVRRASLSDFDGICALLGQFNNKELSKEDWKTLFTHNWGGANDASGYVLVNRENIVGYFGTIFKLREFHGVKRKMCNLTSWIVDPQFRGQSLELLYRILEHSDVTITCLTASEIAGKIYKAKGFKILDSGTAIIPVMPGWLNKQKGGVSHKGLEVLTDGIDVFLSDDEKKLHEDHKPYRCNHFVIRRGLDNCYLIATPIKLQWLKLGYVHYIGNYGLLHDTFTQAARLVADRLKVNALMIDLRMLRDLPVKMRFNYPREKYFRPVEIESWDVDNLYSEMILLRHGFFEDLPHAIRTMYLKDKPLYLEMEKTYIRLRRTAGRIFRALRGVRLKQDKAAS
jgi:hypothetical protein